MKPFTILHTIQTGGPGGAETVLYRLATGLEPGRYRSVALVSREGWLKQRLEEAGVPTYVAAVGRWHDLGILRALCQVVRKEGVDLIHSHLPGQNFYGCVAGRLTNRKTICTYHGEIELSDAENRRGGIKLWFVRRSAAAVTVVADKMYQRLLQVGMPAAKLVRIYNGIDVAGFKDAAAGHFRSELKVAEKTRLVGAVANVRQSKGHEFLIRAARKVLDKFPATLFVVAGDVPSELGGTLKQLVHELGLDDSFRFLGFRQDVPVILKDLDLFVLPSISEGLPLVVLEAMAAGKPMVVTRSGGPEEVIEDGRTGLLVPSADADALAQAICRLLENPGLASELGRNARAAVEERFSLSQMIREYQNLYERCLESE